MGSHLSDNQKRLLAQILGQDEQKIEEGTYTMVFTEYTPERIAELHKYDNERYQIRATGKKLDAWTRCPSCGRQVLEKQLLKKGCYLCGWKGTKEEVEWGEIEGSSQVAEYDTLDEIKRMDSYKINCPHCGAQVVREQLIEQGCYICGWKPK